MSCSGIGRDNSVVKGLMMMMMMRQGCPLFHVVSPAFPLPTAVSPTLQGSLMGSFREAAMLCDMLESCVSISY